MFLKVLLQRSSFAARVVRLFVYHQYNTGFLFKSELTLDSCCDIFHFLVNRMEVACIEFIFVLFAEVTLSKVLVTNRRIAPCCDTRRRDFMKRDTVDNAITIDIFFWRVIFMFIPFGITDSSAYRNHIWLEMAYLIKIACENLHIFFLVRWVGFEPTKLIGAHGTQPRIR